MKWLKEQTETLKTKIGWETKKIPVILNLSTIVHSENIYILEYRDFVKKVILVMLNTLS